MANYFANGIKGRPDEAKFADHVELESEMSIQVPDGGGLKTETISTRNGMNEITRTGICQGLQCRPDPLEHGHQARRG